MDNESKLGLVVTLLLLTVAIFLAAHVVVFLFGLVMPLLKLVVLAGVLYVAFLVVKSFKDGTKDKTDD